MSLALTHVTDEVSLRQELGLPQRLQVIVLHAQEAFAAMYNSSNYGLEALSQQATRHLVCSTLRYRLTSDCASRPWDSRPCAGRASERGTGG
jgi:hypothetical protein